MQHSLLALGIVVFMLGVWGNVGVFLSAAGVDKPITWITFLIPVSITGIGIMLIALGLKLKRANQNATTVPNS
jgi:hypothetical protein